VVQAGQLVISAATGEVLKVTPAVNPDGAACHLPSLGGTPGELARSPLPGLPARLSYRVRSKALRVRRLELAHIPGWTVTDQRLDPGLPPESQRVADPRAASPPVAHGQQSLAADLIQPGIVPRRAYASMMPKGPPGH